MKKSLLTDKPIGPTSYSPQSGTGLGSFFSKVGSAISNTNNFLQRSRAISKVSGVVGDLTGNQSVKNFSSYAAKNGYGRTGRVVVPNVPLDNNLIVVKRRGRKPGPKKGKKKAKK